MLEGIKLNSRLVLQRECETDDYKEFCGLINEVPRIHRKQWEFWMIYDALRNDGMLKPGKRGVVFGVGNEPLPALFAKMGCEIVATDQTAELAVAQGWSTVYANNLAGLNDRGICDPEVFLKRVEYKVPVDMNAIDPSLRGFDFAWSSCSFEHLGSIELGLQFVVSSMLCLKPGGLAVHTTEYNVNSNDETAEEGAIVIFRKRDIYDLKRRLTEQGCSMYDFDGNTGSDPYDIYVDDYPYQASPHLKLFLYGHRFVSTSVGLIIRA